MYLHDHIIHFVYLQQQEQVHHVQSEQQQEVPQYYQPPLLPNTAVVSTINTLIIRLFIY